eukprot:symbB.v1.2.007764.t1/scaffold480.1/size253386/26
MKGKRRNCLLACKTQNTSKESATARDMTVVSSYFSFGKKMQTNNEAEAVALAMEHQGRGAREEQNFTILSGLETSNAML